MNKKYIHLKNKILMPINKKKYIIYLFLCVLAGSLLYYFKDNKNLRFFLGLKTGSGPGPGKCPSYIHVLIRGAVNAPGLYVLKTGSFFNDLLEQSKGFQRYADKDWIKGNSLLRDGAEYYIPKRKLCPGERININHADLEDLCMLPGITKSVAREIIHYRNMYEHFDELEEVKEVDGIGEKRFSQIKKFITIGE